MIRRAASCLIALAVWVVGGTATALAASPSTATTRTASSAYTYDVTADSSSPTTAHPPLPDHFSASIRSPADSSTSNPSALRAVFVAAETGGLDLSAAEQVGGHTLARRVGMSDQALISRNIPYASTFTDQAAAESATAQNIPANSGAISKWLSGSSSRLAIQSSLNIDGTVYERATQTFIQLTGVSTVLVRTSTGYNVLTSYPTP